MKNLFNTYSFNSSQKTRIAMNLKVTLPLNWHPNNFNNWIDKINNHVKESKL